MENTANWITAIVLSGSIALIAVYAYDRGLLPATSRSKKMEKTD